MNNYIKPPTLSTSFSESGKSAKKRFDNILNIKAKKTGVLAFAIMFAVIAVVGAMVAGNSISGKNEYTLKTDKLTELALMPIGADMATLDYASNDRVILHYGYALIIYDVKNEKILRALDLSFLNVPINMHGDTVITVRAGEDGKEVLIGSTGANNGYNTYLYDVEKNTVKKINKPELKTFFKGLTDMDITSVNGWSSIKCVEFSEKRRCYLLLTGSNVCDIKIIFEDGENKTQYSVFSNVSVKTSIDELLNKICSSPETASNPGDYIKQHQSEFDKIVAMDTAALSYMFEEFEKGGQNDLRGHIMMNACRSILGIEDIKYTASTGQHWYDAMKDFVRNQVYINGSDFVKEKYPKASIITDIIHAWQIESFPEENYKNIMEHISKEFNKTYSPHYIIANQFPSNYTEKIGSDEFEATFLYKMIFKNYYKDPDTVGYIKEAKEKGSSYYQTMYDEYNLEKEANYDFRVTAKILNDGRLDMSTLKLYTNISPKGIKWEEIKDLSVFIGGMENE